MMSRELGGKTIACWLVAWTLPVAVAAAQQASVPHAGAGQGYSPAAQPPVAQQQFSQGAMDNQPAYRVAQHTSNVLMAQTLAAAMANANPDEHPLMPAIRWARARLETVRQIHDYSAIMVKRENIGGKLAEEEYAFVKIRHQPLSVYMYFLKPEDIRGQEVIWIQGANNGRMWAHGTGLKKMFGTVSLSPTSPFVMKNNRYPISEIGIINLVERLIEVAEHDAQYGECEVTCFPDAKINGRPCTCIQVVHPEPRSNFRFHIARVFVDNELNVPVRYESYDWPQARGGPPVLLEQYTYLNMALNNGFTDADFDIRNPQYNFISQ